MKKQVAEEVSRMVEGIFEKLLTLNNYVIDNCEGSQQERIRRALALCITELDLEILEPIYREYPELKPAFLP
jgi:hypothetical protein